MDFEIETVKGLENKPLPSVLGEKRKAPPSMPDRPFMCALIASRGGGKTTALINLVKMYAPYHFFDKVIFLSPTARNDPKTDLLNDERYQFEHHEDITHELIEDVLDRIKYDVEEYKKYNAYIKVWKRFLKAKNAEQFIDQASVEDIVLLQEHNYEPPETQWVYGMPQTLVICDDLVGNKAIYNNPKLNQFLLRHRHYMSYWIFCSQVWRGAIPKTVRMNLSLLMLFANKSKVVRKEIAEELSSYTSPDQFEAIWEFATEEPHSFLMVDFDNRKNMFRRNFNEIIRILKSKPIIEKDAEPTV